MSSVTPATNPDFLDTTSPDFPKTAEPDISQFAHTSKYQQTKKTGGNSDLGAVSVGSDDGTSPKIKKPLIPKKKKLLIGIAVVALLILSLFGTLGFYSYTVAVEIKTQSAVVSAVAKEAYTAFKNQDLIGTQNKVESLSGNLDEISNTYKKLALFKFIPGLRAYYLDGEHSLTAAHAGLSAGKKTLAAITPYADVLGFAGEGSFQGGTTEDRLKILLETLDKVAPELNAIAADLAIVDAELSTIDPERYPEQIGDTALRSNIVALQSIGKSAVTTLTEYRPVIEQLPDVAGARGTRKKYLVLFQNDNELRPTGGFLTAYAIINVENGKVEAEKSDDIYELDQKYKKTQLIPKELGRYLTTEKYWNLRDMNTSPDFKTSMDTIYGVYKTIPGEPNDIDGIIAVDTHFLTSLMTVLGPIEVPGYGTFSAENDPRCDCPQIIYVLSEIITRPTPYLREDRKGILGPLMRSLLSKAYAAPKQQWPTLFAEGFKSVEGRNVQFYFLDEKNQSAAELAEAAGRMASPEKNQDFLGIINANLGGAKSNLFTEYGVEQVISAPKNGYLEKTVEITYRNTRHGDNCNLEAGLLCLNSTLKDWTRIYVPEGAQLISAQGFTEEAKTYDEAGFTVFDGFFLLEPKGTAKLQLTYKIPYTNEKEYTGTIWKQGGLQSFDVLFDVAGGQEKVTVNKNITYTAPF